MNFHALFLCEKLGKGPIKSQSMHLLLVKTRQRHCLNI